jgi:hypothetical protein
VVARAHKRGGDGRKSLVERCGVNRGGEAPFIRPGEGLQGSGNGDGVDGN